LEWSDEGLRLAADQLDGYYRILWKYRDIPWDINLTPDTKFVEYLHADLNVPGALARLHELFDQLQRGPTDAADIVNVIRSCGQLIGIFDINPDYWFHNGVDIPTVELLVGARDTARKTKNWAQSDSIRDQLAEIGVVLEDSNNETFWRVNRQME
jgi:cysteinyl-tRNA synthetase